LSIDDFNAFGFEVMKLYRRQAGTASEGSGGHDHRAFVEAQMRRL
jgi:hypothetical protein